MFKRLAGIIALICVVVVTASADSNSVREINQDEFLTKVFNYRNDSVDLDLPRPVVVDFWAPWCAPCLRLAPIIDSLAVKYAGQVDFYKLNIDDNPQLAKDLGLGSIPLVVFFPNDSRPMRGATGVQPDSFYDQAIQEYLLPRKDAKN
jgi:thioredoxin